MLLYVPPRLTLKNYTFGSQSVCMTCLVLRKGSSYIVGNYLIGS